jgi:nicotinamidase-related amidase
MLDCPRKLNKEDVLLVLVDVQGKLAKIIYESKNVIDNIAKMIQGMSVLDVPIVWVEQYPEGLGSTVWKVAKYLEGYKPIRKITFDASQNEAFVEAVKATGRRQIIIVGLEAHICIYQTAIGLKNLGYEVQVSTDAVSSRKLANKEIGLTKMRSKGIEWTSVETALFELVQIAEGETFKRILKLLK